MTRVSPFTVLVLYPLWAVALATGLVALRLGRETRAGLVVLSAALAFWVSGLVLLTTGSEVAERVVPAGILLAGALVHAGQDVAKVRNLRVLGIAYGYSAVVALVGVLSPRLLYGPGARGAGPLFLPVAIVSAFATALAFVYLLSLARLEAPREERRRRMAVALACAAGAPGAVASSRSASSVAATSRSRRRSSSSRSRSSRTPSSPASRGARAISSCRAPCRPSSPRSSPRSGSRCSTSPSRR